jgi:hypothetical protein
MPCLNRGPPAEAADFMFSAATLEPEIKGLCACRCA